MQLCAEIKHVDYAVNVMIIIIPVLFKRVNQAGVNIPSLQ